MSRPVRHRSKWRIRWFDSDGKRRSKTFSTHRDAEKALAMYQAEAERVSVGLSPKPAPKKTFDHLCDYWLEHRTTRKKSSKDDRSVINASLRPHFKGMQLSEITLEDVDRFRRLRGLLDAGAGWDLDDGGAVTETQDLDLHTEPPCGDIDEDHPGWVVHLLFLCLVLYVHLLLHPRVGLAYDGGTWS